MTSKSNGERKWPLTLSKIIRQGLTESDYVLIHRWLRTTYGRADRCENKSCPQKSTQFEWALKTECKYEYVRENFMMLCKGCHRKYDVTDEIRKKIGQASRLRKVSKLTKMKMARAHQGESNYQTVLTDDNIKEIRKSIKNGIVARRLAEKFGVSEKIISNIKTRRTWKHIN